MFLRNKRQQQGNREQQARGKQVHQHQEVRLLRQQSNGSIPEHDVQRPRSLRLRLMLWYGTLLIVALACFAALILVLTTDAIGQSVDSAVRAEARIAMLDLQPALSPTSPYWPAQLSLNVVDTYRDPGVAVEILDAQGHTRYHSASGTATDIPVSTETMQDVLAGQMIWYDTTVGSEHVRVEALPVRVPVANEGAGVADVGNSAASSDELPTSGQIIGVLLVAKSLEDADATLLLLRTLLLLAGIVTLGGTLIGSWAIATRVLRPLTGIVTTAQAIALSTARGTRLGNLSQRVPRSQGHDEMAQVVDTFNEMLTALESATRTQRRFVADASHELRAPLTTIQGNLAFLQRHMDELPPQERRTMLADAHEETLRLAKLVEELLLLARADANVDTLPKTEAQEITEAGSTQGTQLVELDHTVLQLIRQLRRRLSLEGSPLKLEIGRIVPVRVRGDEEMLRRVALILLDNAIKYTPVSSEEERGRVIVSLEREENHAVLRVRDTGIGIDPAELPHLFERFYRTDRARSRQGTGLGLSIAQTLVEQMGGQITAESTPGKGSTFSVLLPLTALE